MGCPSRQSTHHKKEGGCVNSIPSYQRLCMTVEEAAEYSMLGENRLRKIIEENKALDWILYIGSRVRIKRKQFEEWVYTQSNL